MVSEKVTNKLQFRERPGCRERHVRRKLNNPLFPAADRYQTQDDVAHAQRLDNQELGRFMKDIRELVEKITNLEPNVDSEVILKLKSEVDRYYEQCTGLPGEQKQVKEALVNLIDALMSAIRNTASVDQKALDELEQEKLARKMHYSLLEYSLTGDLLRSNSPIEANELVPTLLSESSESLKQILPLFESSQLRSIRDQAQELIDKRKQEGLDLSEAEQRLTDIDGYIHAHAPEAAIN